MCWLCTYQGEELAVQLNTFIIKNIGYVDMECISQLVSDFVLLKEPLAQGADKETMYLHIHSHMLHPRVRIAVMLRQLLEFSALLYNSMVVREGGLTTVDKGNSELYLKVLSQITTMYRMDPQTMLFAEDGQGDQDEAAAPGLKRPRPSTDGDQPRLKRQRTDAPA